MTKILSLMWVLAAISNCFGQKVEYKNGVITVDGNAIASMKVVKNSESMGMANTFEIYNTKNEMLIIAAWVSEFPDDPNDNMNYYYKLSFVGIDKTGYFKVAKLGAEKSVAKLVGSSGVIKDGTLDDEAVFKFIAERGKTPPAKPADYSLVSRDKAWPIELKQGGLIEQNSKQIGSWKDVSSSGSNVAYYEFYLPSGLKIASVNFQNGNNAQSCEVNTMKDAKKQLAPIPSQDHVIASASVVDRNYEALKRIVNWLVANQYL